MKFARVNMSNKTIAVEDVPQNCLGLGGRGLTSISLESETIWAMGGMTGIEDLDTMARLDYLCDDIGVDTMRTGVAVGQHFNHERVPVVKGQSIAAYNSRAMLGNGVTFATSPMGADHTAGNVVGEYLEQKLDPLNVTGQVEAWRHLQIATAYEEPLPPHNTVFTISDADVDRTFDF
jgi:aldehyde:ferredoxin oxidoreductase